MERKIEKNYTYNGLLFPIVLDKVEMVHYQDEWHPKLNVLKLSNEAIKTLALSQHRLTGNQIKFIRNYFNMSLRQFANDVVNVSHGAVAKWEKTENSLTSMDINIEKIIRLYICEKLMAKTFFNDYKKINKLDKNDSSCNVLEKFHLAV